MVAKLVAVLPKSVLKTKKLESELYDVLTKIERNIKDDFEKTVKTWDKKPEFKTTHKGPDGDDLVLEVSTDNEIYGYVSGGTRPHEIRPRKAKALAFQANYRAKTVPKRLPSRKGGKSGPTVIRQSVQHPGTEAREFEKLIMKRQQPKFRRFVQQAIKNANQ